MQNVEEAFDNTSHGESVLIRKGVGNTVAFWMGKMLREQESRNADRYKFYNHEHYLKFSAPRGPTTPNVGN